MRLGLLLERDYTPYWKWLAHEFRKQPVATQLDPRLRQVCEPQPREEQTRQVGDICRIVHELLSATELANADLTGHPHSLFRDHSALRARLDAELANRA
jgi:hypothetical protein